MTPRRVFSIDDSVVVRRMLSDIVGAEPGLQMVGTAPNGMVALAKLATMPVDVITLDVEMPEMNGLEVLVQLKQRFPRIPVIMFSSLTERAAKTTLDALALGATDYVTKPTMTGSREASIAHVRSQLVPRLHALTSATPSGFIAKPRPTVRTGPEPHGRTEVVVIGASTGGPNAIADLCKRLIPLAVPILVVQHMPPVFTALFAQRLTNECAIPFVEAADGMVAAPGRGYIAPGDHHLRVTQGAHGLQLALDRGAPENSCRPAVDVLFRSAAATCKARTLAVVLTGMGHDGLAGGTAIKAAGGRVLAQDESSSVVWGMPGAVAREGVADSVLTIPELASELAQCAGPRSARHAG